MAGDLAVRVQSVSKRYRIGERESERYRTMRDSLARGLGSFSQLRSRQRTDPEETSIWALRDVDLEVAQGQVMAIVGRNGAGKSTLLKILSRVTEPTSGRVEIRGRVGSLLEVGTGFHPELTGRENVYLNGAILGMPRTEIARKLDEIVAFAEVETFLDTPVKRYSSGMQMRLAFSVAAHLEPEVLLLDEVLAVGDIAFQRKCMGKMDEVARAGRTVVFVSHNMAAVRQFCPVAVLIADGRVARTGPTPDVLQEYLRTSIGATETSLAEHRGRRGTGEAIFTSVRLEDGDGTEMPVLLSGQPARIVLSVSSDSCRRQVRAVVDIRDAFDQKITSFDSALLPQAIDELPADGELVLEIPRVHLAPGRYTLGLRLKAMGDLLDRVDDAGTIDVVDADFHDSGKAVPEGSQLALMAFSWQAKEREGPPPLDPVATPPGLRAGSAAAPTRGDGTWPS